jgi:ATP-dependent helicase/DNAse subunit B
MKGDIFSAVWISHTSISDFLRCPRSYYLKHIYRNPETGHKIKIVSPPLSLGQTVHQVIESLSILPTEKRFNKPLAEKLELVWQNVSGKRGGFLSPEIENQYKTRAYRMLERMSKHPGPLKNLSVKIKMSLPNFWLSEKDNIILCGKIDWLEYISTNDTIHVIDFKTTKMDEDPKSLQLAIYCLLVSKCQHRRISQASYWYIERNNNPTSHPLPDLREIHEQILKIGKQIKLVRQLGVFKCPHKTGCSSCLSMEKIVRGDAEFVGINNRNEDMYIVDFNESEKNDSEIL